MNRADKRAVLDEIHDMASSVLISWPRVELFVDQWRSTGLAGGGGGIKGKNEISDPTFRASQGKDVVMIRHVEAVKQMGLAHSHLWGSFTLFGEQLGYVLAVSLAQPDRSQGYDASALSAAQGSMRAVDKHVRWCLTPSPEVAKHNAGLAKCANQFGCPDDAWASKAGRCQACYEYNRRTQRDRVKAA